MGKEAGDFENDAWWKLHALTEGRERAVWILNGAEGEELEEPSYESAFALKQTDFVFLCGDYNFLFFDTTAGDDPPVVVVEETDKCPGVTVPSFSQWLRLTIKSFTEILEGVQHMR